MALSLLIVLHDYCYFSGVVGHTVVARYADNISVLNSRYCLSFVMIDIREECSLYITELCLTYQEASAHRVVR